MLPNRERNTRQTPSSASAPEHGPRHAVTDAHVTSEGSVAKVHRYRVDGLPSIDLDHALMVDPSLAKAFQRAVNRPKAKSAVSQLLDPLVGFGSLPTREEFDSLKRWAPFPTRIVTIRMGRTLGAAHITSKIHELAIHSGDVRGNKAQRRAVKHLEALLALHPFIRRDKRR